MPRNQWVLSERCERIVAAELDRLRRCLPELGPQELDVVTETLERVSDQLVMVPVRRHPQYEDAVEALFAVPADTTRRDHERPS